MGHVTLEHNKRAGPGAYIEPASGEDARVSVGPEAVTTPGGVVKPQCSLAEALRANCAKFNLGVISHDEICAWMSVGEYVYAALRVSIKCE